MSDKNYQFDSTPAPIVAVRNKLLSVEASQKSEEAQIDGILKTIATLHETRTKRLKDIKDLRTWLSENDVDWLTLHDEIRSHNIQAL